MTAELIINGSDAWSTYGVRMGERFIEELLKPCSIKAFVENSDRSRNGKQVIYYNPRLSDRDLTLSFNLHGMDTASYLDNYKRFCALLQQGPIMIEVPAIGNEVYRLTYINSANFALSRDRTSSSMSVKFNEPDPSNRTKQAEE